MAHFLFWVRKSSTLYVLVRVCATKCLDRFHAWFARTLRRPHLPATYKIHTAGDASLPAGPCRRRRQDRPRSRATNKVVTVVEDVLPKDPMVNVYVPPTYSTYIVDWPVAMFGSCVGRGAFSSYETGGNCGKVAKGGRINRAKHYDLISPSGDLFPPCRTSARGRRSRQEPAGATYICTVRRQQEIYFTDLHGNDRRDCICT